MKFLDLTLPTPQQNLACDEALLDWCGDGREQEILRFWEPQQHFIVLGYSNKTQSAVNLPACRRANIPILRRCSGGGAVLQGPGCLNYSLILKVEDSSPFKTIDGTTSWVMKRHQRALEPIFGSGIQIQGLSDLALGPWKFSGNAQYRRRRLLLFHGAFLLALDIQLMENLLPVPSKAPPYRDGRSHREFLTNLHLSAGVIKTAIRKSWNATSRLEDVPWEKIEALARERYSNDRWNFKF